MPRLNHQIPQIKWYEHTKHAHNERHRILCQCINYILPYQHS